ncbi:hypothetical protein ACJX0J_014024 [Zea mays]
MPPYFLFKHMWFLHAIFHIFYPPYLLILADMIFNQFGRVYGKMHTPRAFFYPAMSLLLSVDQFLQKEKLTIPAYYAAENKTSLTRIMLDNMVVPLGNGDLDVSMLKDARLRG